MWESIVWWALVEIIGIAVFPIAFRFFRNLPDRGYAFSKPLGLLFLAYPFWLLTSFGFLNNTQGTILLLLVLIGGTNWGWIARLRVPTVDPVRPHGTMTVGSERPRAVDVLHNPNGHSNPEALAVRFLPSPIEWLRENRKPVLVTELVFTVAFALWVSVRAFMPEITATEKPMEFAFLNGILQSARFPPLDPWLSGYAISYYYFGYVIMAMLTLVSGIASNIAFNLAIALLFALAATGAFGLAYNLIQGQFPSAFRAAVRSLTFAVLAPVLLVLMGNLEGVFEALHTRRWGSETFWKWLDINGLAGAPVTGTFVPSDNWWWWRASRVVHDVVDGKTQEVIDEFPQFSFLLGDMHPHVLALPFVLLALAVALNLVRGKHFGFGDIRDLVHRDHRASALSFIGWLAFISLIFGALPFLNFWDVLPYGFILVVAYGISRFRTDNGWTERTTRDLGFFVGSLVILALIMYLPFFVGFQSQAGGLLPVLFVKTRLHQYLIMFGAFLLIFAGLLLRLVYEHRDIPVGKWVRNTLQFGIAIAAIPFAVAVFTLMLLTASPSLQGMARDAFPDASGNVVALVLGAFVQPLLADPWMTIVVGVFLTFILALLRFLIVDWQIQDTSKTFVLLLVLTGTLLTYGVEFVYLRDVFGNRMNTVFKFYFQAWTLFSVAGAFGIYYVFEKLKGAARVSWVGLLTVIVLAGLVYPVLAIPNRADNFAKSPTLDGTAWMQTVNPSDYAGIQWLAENAPRGAHIVESTGRQYSYDNRISMATGLPTILGWMGHEDQWRGSSKLYRDETRGIDRPGDVARIYQTVNPQEALTLLDKYAINFVVVGQTERSLYNLNQAQIDKFSKALALVFENGDLRIYSRSR